MSGKLDPETKRLRRLSPGALADEIGALEARVDALKAEAIRRELRRAEGEDYRITLTPPGTAGRAAPRSPPDQRSPAVSAIGDRAGGQ